MGGGFDRFSLCCLDVVRAVSDPWPTAWMIDVVGGMGGDFCCGNTGNVGARKAVDSRVSLAAHTTPRQQRWPNRDWEEGEEERRKERE